jgi:hypothetical protein
MVENLEEQLDNVWDVTFSLEHVVFEMINVFQELEGKFVLSPTTKVKVILA